MNIQYITAFIVALIVSIGLTPVAKWLAAKFKVIDNPNERKIHSRNMPRWGGMAIYLGFMLGVITLYVYPRFHALLAFRHKVFEKEELIDILSLNNQFMGILIGGTIIFILGLVDDKKGVSAVPKFLIQIIAALSVINYGVNIPGLNLPFFGGFVNFPLWLCQIITVFWLIGFMNTINLIDGLDGLAAGVVAIASATFLIVAILQSDTKIILFSKQLKLAAILCSALTGACIGFLYHNFHPAKIFMGDSGSQFLGFMLGAITVIGTLKTTAVVALIIPITVVAFPVLDVAFSILRRYSRKTPIMTADKEHFHHRLLNLGWTHREIVLLVYVITFVLSLCAILLTVTKGRV
ncbi:MAG: undecaprenyl/decaprenyl-phosphate alpha-N-acetylglucosaminyl 1-phosphate transferase [Elusimicrobia bacterium]|nr:undecaprenyl/decaprenyl-phosphate alpha-N-acetylglucosaminyl 1-phosphate transferase [Elusimicrobiota bacterium]